METIFLDGARIDTRSEGEKAKDIQFKEIVASVAPVVWVEKPGVSWRKFPIFNQDGSGSCVAQTMAKIMGILYYIKNSVYVHFSATHIYQRRSNKPQGGMSGVECFEIAKTGATLEVLVPSQDMNDTQMDGIKIEKYKEDVGKIFKIGEPVYGPIKDIETVASIIQQTGKAVMVWYYFDNNEWTDMPVVLNPALNLYAPGTARHSVTAVDFTLYQGKKCLIIEDSWGPNFGKGGQRIITEDWHKARNWFVGHAMNFQFDVPTPVKPQHNFTVDMWFGQVSEEIKALQNCLKYEGLFPSNVDSTGFFGAVTQKAVQGFQIKYGITTVDGPGYGRVGPITRAKLNQLFN